MASPRWFSGRSLLLVIGGGAIGVALRALVLVPLGTDGHPLVVPAVTVVINLAGSFLLGAVVGRLDGRHPHVRMFFGTGVLGGFTTYSAFMTGTDALWAEAPLLAVAYAMLSLALGLSAAVLGLRIGRPRPAGRRAGAAS